MGIGPPRRGAGLRRYRFHYRARRSDCRHLSLFRQATLSWVLARDCPSDGSIVFLAPEEFLALTGTINHRNDLLGKYTALKARNSESSEAVDPRAEAQEQDRLVDSTREELIRRRAYDLYERGQSLAMTLRIGFRQTSDW